MATRLIMLGTGGGPRPRRDRAATSHALIVDDVLYAVDCGHPVARQLAAAGVALPALRHVFVTHHHSITTPTTAASCSSRGRAGCGRAWTPGGRRRSRR